MFLINMGTLEELVVLIPVYIALGLTLMSQTYKKTPRISFKDAILSIIGSVYFIGLLGAYLSTPIGNVLFTNILKISFVLCLFVFSGNILLSLSLLKVNINIRRPQLLFILSNVIILVFAGIENWMALGSLIMLIGMFPLTKIVLNSNIDLLIKLK